MTLSGLT